MPKAATVSNQEVSPNPQLEKRTRRIFTVDYKLSILQQADACQHGELGVLLRREKLYSNQLSQWRREFSEQGIEGLGKSQPGPKAHKTPEQKRIEQLEKEFPQLSFQYRTSIRKDEINTLWLKNVISPKEEVEKSELMIDLIQSYHNLKVDSLTKIGSNLSIKRYTDR